MNNLELPEWLDDIMDHIELEKQVVSCEAIGEYEGFEYKYYELLCTVEYEISKAGTYPIEVFVFENAKSLEYANQYLAGVGEQYKLIKGYEKYKYPITMRINYE